MEGNERRCLPPIAMSRGDVMCLNDTDLESLFVVAWRRGCCVYRVELEWMAHELAFTTRFFDWRPPV